MTNKVTVLRTKHFNMNLAEKMLAARKNQRIVWEEAMTELSPKFQAIQDFDDGLNENPFPKNSVEWEEYSDAWFDKYLIEFKAEQGVPCQ